MKKIRIVFVIGSLLLISNGCKPPDKKTSTDRENKPEVLIIDDFEDISGAGKWGGTLSPSKEHASHGNKSARLSSGKDKSVRIETQKIPEDWSSFELLKFDIFNPSERLLYGTIHIYDRSGNDEEAEFQGQSYNGEDKLFLNTGWNHFEFMLKNAMVEEGNRPLALSQIRKLSFDFGQADTSVFLDNIRLVSGNEATGTNSRISPGDCIVTIDNREVYTSLAGPPDKIRISPEIIQLRQKADSAVEGLRNDIRVAEMQGFQTLYHRIPLITADIGMGVRSRLVWFQNETEEKKILEYVISSCRKASGEISSLISSRKSSIDVSEPENEVSSASFYVPPYPPLKDLKPADGFYRDKTGAPVLVFSMLQIDNGPLLDYFAPFDHRLESYTVGGGSRYDIESSPVYEAFHKYPGTHRVGWDGWCGHLIKDRWSMGGKKEDVVICLESPHIRQAVLDFIKIRYSEWKNNPHLLYNIMAYELQYICYCDESRRMFRDWLTEKYKSVSRLNTIWKTSYDSFSEIEPPPTHNARPVDGVNRAAWYDWACFNSRRFTDYLKWIKTEMRKLESDIPICAGGTSSMLSSSNSVTGIDEELIINEVDDVILNESGSSPVFSDLLLSLSDNRKVMVEPEMGGGTHNLLLQFLHGKSDIAKWWWGAYPSREFMHLNQTSLPHSKEISLADIDEVLRIALDIRRLGPEIAEFTREDPEIAILYSKTSIIQVPPGQIQEGRTPYIDAIYSVWEGSRFLGCRVGFVSERQILNKKLDKIKLLIIPAVKYIVPEVADEIKSFVEKGGTVLVIPESFIFDQYGREADKISEFGISIKDVTLPEAIGSEGKKQNYDQSFSKPVIYGKIRSKITALPEDIFSGTKLQSVIYSDGLKQTIDPGSGKVIAEFEDGKPAIVVVNAGKGSLYYLAAPLAPEYYHVLFSLLARKTGVNQPVTAVDSAGNLITGAEVRAVEQKSYFLAYASNLTPVAIEFDLRTKTEIESITDLRSLKQIEGMHIILKPYDETIYKIEKKRKY